ncbi:RHS repeat-associated core domain-containing protein [Caballeronia sp. BR00000012568055]|uniref:RHS repeat-associated core domain-containing protein n=1 Tax=Caballeronia sp. BR00000012568055 TaxID=2918761 RepID=UPI0023F91F20|nr:RHS repeat-associated core domain-containing protein [Caballeronia sp. BR00000012568055]
MSVPAVKHFDPVVGVDVHMVNIPPSPAPVPLPHPHVGFVLDLDEYSNAAKAAIGAIESALKDAALEAVLENCELAQKAMAAGTALAGKAVAGAMQNPAVAAALKAKKLADAAREKYDALKNMLGAGAGSGGGGRPILVNGMMRTTLGTHTYHVPGLHFPLGAGFGGPDAKIPSHDSEAFMGSKTVLANNDPMSFGALPALSCSVVGMKPSDKKGSHMKRDYLSLPTSVMLPIPAGRPVLVGGPPMLNIAATLKGLFLAFRGSALAKRLFEKFPSGFVKCVIFDAEPVNSVTGEVVVQQNDFKVAGRLPLVWNRFYASHDAYCGSAGRGWQTLADTRLELTLFEGEYVAYAAFCDHLAAFAELPRRTGWEARVHDLQNGHALYRDGDDFVLRTRESCEYRYPLPRTWEQEVAFLAPHARLVLRVSQLSDLNGNAWRFERLADGALRRMVEWSGDAPAGRAVSCDAGRFTLHDAEGVSHPLVRYEVDAARNLVAVFDALDKPYCFDYAASGNMVRHTDRNGLSFHYSHRLHEDGLWRVDHAWGDHGLFDYRFVYDTERLETRLTNSLGHTTVLQYDERDLPVARIGPLGDVYSYQYDERGRTCAEIDPAGHVTTWTYDELGNLLALTRPDQSVVAITYDEAARPVCFVDPDGGAWRQEWDARGNLLAQSTPLGVRMRYRYDARGQLICVIDSAGQDTRLGYDAYGFVARLIDPLGNVTRFEHDARGNVVRRIDADGGVSAFRHDAKNRLTSARLRGADTVNCAYDAEDELTRYVDEMGRETRFEYFGQGRLCARTDPDGSRVQYRYDTEEQLTGVINQRGEVWQLIRDAGGRLVAEVDYWKQARRYSYDIAGHLTRTVDALGQTLAMTCDPLGRVVARRADDGEEERFAYDARGHLIEARNACSTVERLLDADGNLIRETQRLPGGAAAIDYAYDAAGRLSSQTQSWRNAGGEAAVLSETQRFTYDVRGWLARHRIGDHEPLRLSVDALGRLDAQRVNDRLTFRFAYDAAGRLVRQAAERGSAASGGSGESIEYRYDAAGNLTQRRDSRLGTDAYRYDPLGRIVAHMDPAGEVHRFVHDRAGDRFSAVRADGDERVLLHHDGTVLRMNRAGQVVRQRTPGGAVQDLHWDAFGRLRRLVDEKGERWEYAYDALDRRVCKARQDDAARTWFAWDGDKLAAEVSGDETVAASARLFVYRLRTFVPLAMQELERSVDASADRALLKETALFFYETDPNGAPVRLRDAEGAAVWAARYGVTGEAKNIDAQGVEQPIRLQGQYFDAESGLHYNRYRYFDPGTESFVSQDPIGLIGGLNTYRFASNSFAWADPLGLAPWENGKFTAWFDKASVQDIIDNKTSVSSALRGSGGMHEFFPVSLAPKAKELGFSADELLSMKKPTEDIQFTGVKDKKGNIIPDGDHHCSRAGRHFHNQLIAKLQKASSKAEALGIISAMNAAHIK